MYVCIWLMCMCVCGGGQELYILLLSFLRFELLLVSYWHFALVVSLCRCCLHLNSEQCTEFYFYVTCLHFTNILLSISLLCMCVCLKTEQQVKKKVSLFMISSVDWCDTTERQQRQTAAYIQLTPLQSLFIIRVNKSDFFYMLTAFALTGNFRYFTS